MGVSRNNNEVILIPGFQGAVSCFPLQLLSSESNQGPAVLAHSAGVLDNLASSPKNVPSISVLIIPGFKDAQAKGLGRSLAKARERPSMPHLEQQ